MGHLREAGAERSVGAMPGALFEIRIDGTPRTYRDRKDFAMQAARLIKSKIRTAWSRSRTCRAETLPRWL